MMRLGVIFLVSIVTTSCDSIRDQRAGSLVSGDREGSSSVTNYPVLNKHRQDIDAIVSALDRLDILTPANADGCFTLARIIRKNTKQEHLRRVEITMVFEQSTISGIGPTDCHVTPSPITSGTADIMNGTSLVGNGLTQPNEGYGISKTQVMVISTCSAVIGTFFIVAGIIRVRNYIKRFREEQAMSRRPNFRSCTVSLRGTNQDPAEPENYREADGGIKMERSSILEKDALLESQGPLSNCESNPLLSDAEITASSSPHVFTFVPDQSKDDETCGVECDYEPSSPLMEALQTSAISPSDMIPKVVLDDIDEGDELTGLSETADGLDPTQIAECIINMEVERSRLLGSCLTQSDPSMEDTEEVGNRYYRYGNQDEYSCYDINYTDQEDSGTPPRLLSPAPSVQDLCLAIMNEDHEYVNESYDADPQQSSSGADDSNNTDSESDVIMDFTDNLRDQDSIEPSSEPAVTTTVPDNTTRGKLDADQITNNMADDTINDATALTPNQNSLLGDNCENCENDALQIEQDDDRGGSEKAVNEKTLLLSSFEGMESTLV